MSRFTRGWVIAAAMAAMAFVALPPGTSGETAEAAGNRINVLIEVEIGNLVEGKRVVKKAYSSRTPGRLQFGKGHNTFTGFYADLSDLRPGREYEVEVRLPANLKPGQFQGLFFENVETEYTDELID